MRQRRRKTVKTENFLCILTVHLQKKKCKFLKNNAVVVCVYIHSPGPIFAGTVFFPADANIVDQR